MISMVFNPTESLLPMDVEPTRCEKNYTLVTVKNTIRRFGLLKIPHGIWD